MLPIFLLKRDFLQDPPYIYTRIIIKQMSNEKQKIPPPKRTIPH
jgi:hypothetical protein